MKLPHGIALAMFSVSALASAATLNGTVRSRTTGRPAAGDAVIVMSLTNGTTEVGRGATDAGGRFHVAIAGARAPYLVRVVHQGASYQAMAPSAVHSVEVPVYDVSRILDKLVAASDVQRLQTEGDTLQVIEEITVRNASDPPRTLLNDRPFEIQLPAGAQIVGGKVQAGGGRPLTLKPAPSGQPGRYYYRLPLYPGDTRFAVAYLLPYRGEAVIEPKISYPLERLVVTLPSSMKFEARTPGLFQSTLWQGSSNVYEAAAAKAGQSVAFRIWGSGTLVKRTGGQSHAKDAEAARPWAPVTDPQQSGPRTEDRWFLLGALALVLASGAAGFLAHKRKRPQTIRFADRSRTVAALDH